ncbi:CDGSH iron-sulfur domain-containing protein [Variovorax terrae]|uniref:CDGSH iron-sulfur domain-containing protein n=1 Tax=Variovorax terrae TaxID=2923278 RepID=A0A9X1VU57_9BURK|nr:CDGSH iron-sulfur domain-containing protein [Variovorax terrae]MCJ0763377.1 CDGSH iron-sulfur domain-containing protein [Variovorax terrae]
MATHGAKITVVVSKDGPYLVKGAVPISTQTIGTDAQGGSERWEESEPLPVQANCALCRCGQSGHKPYCDGSHSRVGFDGTETASREPFLSQAKVLDGPAMQLADAEGLCAFGRFCDPHGQVWSQVAQTHDPRVRTMFIRQVGHCHSGRLAAWDKATGQFIEPVLPLSIGLVEDPAEQCSGPLWLRGGIAVVSSDGFAYEVRNRVTLCRCGQSNNKPFCDGTHAAVKFNARD